MSPYVSIQLNRKQPEPLYHQLHLQIRERILSGQLPSGSKMPTIRQLASLKNINTVTVVHAYRLLEQEGLVRSRVGSGTFVIYGSDPTVNTSRKGEWAELDSSPGELAMSGRFQVSLTEHAINFASVTPAPDLFPVDDFKGIINQVLDRDRGYAFGYQESQGYYPLRDSVAAYLDQHGIICEADQLQVISGAQQGIDIIAKSLLHPGDYVITECPTYSGALAAFRSRGANIIGVPLQADGMDLDILARHIKQYRPRLVYTMTNFQNPTGVCYSIEKQQALLTLCRQEDIIVIEDDSFSELCYDGQERHAMKRWDQFQQIIYIKSFSKIFMPGLRLAILLAPARLLPNMIAVKHNTDISTSGLLQRAFDLYLNSGLWKSHIQFMQEMYRTRYQYMLDAMQRYFPSDITYHPPGGGLCFWIRFPAGCSCERLYELCLRHQVVIAPGSMFYPDNPDFATIRLSFAALSPAEIEAGIAAIAQCYPQARSGSSRNQLAPFL